MPCFALRCSRCLSSGIPLLVFLKRIVEHSALLVDYSLCCKRNCRRLRPKCSGAVKEYLYVFGGHRTEDPRVILSSTVHRCQRCSRPSTPSLVAAAAADREHRLARPHAPDSSLRSAGHRLSVVSRATPACPVITLPSTYLSHLVRPRAHFLLSPPPTSCRRPHLRTHRPHICTLADTLRGVPPTAAVCPFLLSFCLLSLSCLLVSSSHPLPLFSSRPSTFLIQHLAKLT